MSKSQLTADQYYEFITRRAQNKPAWQMRIAAHVRAKTKHSNLMLYHHNGASEEEKIALYGEIIAAMQADNPDLLVGQIASGQVVVPADTSPDTPPVPTDPEPEKPEPTPTNRIQVEHVEEPNDALRKLREALTAIGVSGAQPSVDLAPVHDRITRLEERINYIDAYVTNELKSLERLIKAVELSPNLVKAAVGEQITSLNITALVHKTVRDYFHETIKQLCDLPEPKL